MKPKHSGGRPTSYRPEFCGRIVALMSEGRSLDRCAALLGVHPDSLYEWQKVHPEFSEAVRAGRAEDTCKAMRDVVKRRRSTVGTRSSAGRSIRQVAAPLDDPREERFVALYVENPNGTQSAIAAGYSPKSAHTIAHRLLKRSKIKEAIARRNAEIMAELDFTPARIVREIAKVAGVNTADFITIDKDTGHPVIDFRGVTRQHLAAVASVENTDKGVKYKTHDKLKALTELAKLARMYPAERTELTGADGGPIQSANLNATVHTMDIASLEPEQRDQLRSVLLALKAKHEAESSEDEAAP
jgi:phage terminase small subunit